MTNDTTDSHGGDLMAISPGDWPTVIREIGEWVGEELAQQRKAFEEEMRSQRRAMDDELRKHRIEMAELAVKLAEMRVKFAELAVSVSSGGGKALDLLNTQERRQVN